MEEKTMKHDLGGRVALVTGATNGIGRAITLGLASRGASIKFSYHDDLEALRELMTALETLGVPAQAYQVDARSPASVGEMIGLLGDEHVDVLVNNVGITTRDGFLDVTEKAFDDVMHANMRFPFLLTQRIVQGMIARGGGGSIINISSISAFKAISMMSHYQCSKAALSMLTKSLAVELAPHRIRVNTISPGLTATKGNRHQWEGAPEIWRERGRDIPLGRAGTPADCVGAALLLASDDAAWITGADIVVDGGEAAI